MEVATAAAFTNESRIISDTETHTRFPEQDVTISMRPTHRPFKLAKQGGRDLDYKQTEAPCRPSLSLLQHTSGC
jgi:hypothetical protein